jgi:hypothetical protein
MTCSVLRALWYSAPGPGFENRTSPVQRKHVNLSAIFQNLILNIAVLNVSSLYWRWTQHAPPKHCCLSTKLHGVIYESNLCDNVGVITLGIADNAWSGCGGWAFWCDHCSRAGALHCPCTLHICQIWRLRAHTLANLGTKMLIQHKSEELQTSWKVICTLAIEDKKVNLFLCLDWLCGSWP